MTLVLLAVIPLIVVTVALLGKLQGKLQASASAAYADANSLVQEACGAIRTVFACTATERLVQGYSKVGRSSPSLAISLLCSCSLAGLPPCCLARCIPQPRS